MAQTFHAFPDLPAELRLEIWQHAHSLFPRVFELIPFMNGSRLRQQMKNPCTSEIYETGRWHVRVSSSPTLLAVNAEARRELLPLYTTPFDQGAFSNKSDGGADSRKTESLLVCHQIDKLFFNVEWPEYVQPSQPGHSIYEIFQQLFGRSTRRTFSEIRCLAATEHFFSLLLKDDSFRKPRRHFGHIEENLEFGSVVDIYVILRSDHVFSSSLSYREEGKLMGLTGVGYSKGVARRVKRAIWRDEGGAGRVFKAYETVRI